MTDPWGAPLHAAAAALAQPLRRDLARAFLRDAADEHAAVGAFAQLSLDLLAVGAPAALVDRAHVAAREEIVHARDAYTLASALAGEPLGPGALPVPVRPPLDLVALAVSSAVDGWRNESMAACVGALRRAGATVPAVRSALDVVVRDEAGHAALAWDVVRFAIDAGGMPVREAVADALATAQPPVADEEPVAPAWGRPGARAIQAVLDDALRRVIAPQVAALVG